MIKIDPKAGQLIVEFRLPPGWIIIAVGALIAIAIWAFR